MNFFIFYCYTDILPCLNKRFHSFIHSFIHSTLKENQQQLTANTSRGSHGSHVFYQENILHGDLNTKWESMALLTNRVIMNFKQVSTRGSHKYCYPNRVCWHLTIKTTSNYSSLLSTLSAKSILLGCLLTAVKCPLSFSEIEMANWLKKHVMQTFGLEWW